MGFKGIRSKKLDLCKLCGKMFLKIEHVTVCPDCLPQKHQLEFGIKLERPQTLRIGRRSPLSRKLTYEYLVEEYVNNKRSLDDIAKQHDCSRMAIMKIMEKYRLARRGQSEARIEAIKKGKFERFEYHEINENFFSKWSPEMAWVLGLLFTDGNVFPGRVSLSSVDLGLLEKVRKLLDSSKPIYKAVQSYDKSKHLYKYEFYHEKMREDLSRLGLHERKSLNMLYPAVPEDCMRHFIRGCWDGDGSIFTSGGKLRGSYACGSLKFIERLVQELYKIGLYKKQRPRDKTEASTLFLKYPDARFPLTIHKEKRSKSYEIKIDSKENLGKLFHYFYDGVDESIYLTRKYNVFVKGLKSEEKAEQLTLDFCP